MEKENDSEGSRGHVGVDEGFQEVEVMKVLAMKIRARMMIVVLVVLVIMVVMVMVRGRWLISC